MKGEDIMIKKLVDIEKTSSFIFQYVTDVLHEQWSLNEIKEMLSEVLKNENCFIYEIYLLDELKGVAIGNASQTEVLIDFIYCNESMAIYELLDFFKNQYQNCTITFYFHQNEEIFYRSFKEKKASLEPVCHSLTYNSYLIQTKNKQDLITFFKYEPKYHKIINKMKPKDKEMNLDMTYVGLIKRKPIGYIEVSLFEDEHIYIEHFNILPKYEQNEIAVSFIQFISKLYINHPVDVIVSAYDDEKIEWYQSLGFEMEGDKTLIEASFH